MEFFLDEHRNINLFRLCLSVILISVLLVVLLGSWAVVPSGYRGVQLRFGAVQGDILGEGISFKLPIIEKVVDMSVQVEKLETSASAASQDLQIVTSMVALNYRLKPGSVNTIYQNFRQEYSLRLIEPAMQEAIKAATARFTASELVTEREMVREEMTTIITNKLDVHGIDVIGINIINFDFSDSFNDAIEAKVTQEERAKEAENRLREIEAVANQRRAEAAGEADAMRITAEARAEAIEIESNALRGNPEILNLRAIENWDGILPRTMLSGDTVPFLNISQ